MEDTTHLILLPATILTTDMNYADDLLLNQIYENVKFARDIDNMTYIKIAHRLGGSVYILKWIFLNPVNTLTHNSSNYLNGCKLLNGLDDHITRPLCQFYKNYEAGSPKHIEIIPESLKYLEYITFQQGQLGETTGRRISKSIEKIREILATNTEQTIIEKVQAAMSEPSNYEIMRALESALSLVTS